MGYGRGEKEKVWCVREEEEDEYTSSSSGTGRREEVCECAVPL